MSITYLSVQDLDIALDLHREGKRRYGGAERMPRYPGPMVELESGDENFKIIAKSLNINSRYLELLYDSATNYHDNEFVMSAFRELITRIKMVDQEIGPLFREQVKENSDRHDRMIKSYHASVEKYNTRHAELPRCFKDFNEVWDKIGLALTPMLEADPASRTRTEISLHKTLFTMVFRFNGFDVSIKNKSFKAQLKAAYSPDVKLSWADANLVPLVHRAEILGGIKGALVTMNMKT